MTARMPARILLLASALCPLPAQIAAPGGAIPSPESVNKYALIIGVSGYPNFHETDRLQYAGDDALLFAQFLETGAAGGFRRENIRTLVNERATRVGIYREIAWIGNRANGDDIVYVFFAGHGMLDESGRAYFMPYDGDPGDPYALGMRADNFLQDLKDRISARQMIFFIDACHAAAVFNRSGSASRDAGNIVPKLNELWDRQFKGLQELNMAFLSASSNQRSLEDESLKHGIFTWYVVDGLRGGADQDRDGKVTAGELRSYVVNKVETLARRRSGQQSPTVSPVFDPQRVLSIYANSALPAGLEPALPNSPGPFSKMAPPIRADFKFTPKVSSQSLGKVNGQERYNFAVSIQAAPDDFRRIVSVVYEFIYQSNPLRMESSQSSDYFAVTYNGWGCYQTVKPTFTLRNPSETIAGEPFNMCKLLGW